MTERQKTGKRTIFFFLDESKKRKSETKIQYSITLLPSVNTLIARGMVCGAKYTHHTFTPIIIKHLITTA